MILQGSRGFRGCIHKKFMNAYIQIVHKNTPVERACLRLLGAEQADTQQEANAAPR